MRAYNNAFSYKTIKYHQFRKWIKKQFRIFLKCCNKSIIKRCLKLLIMFLNLKQLNRTSSKPFSTCLSLHCTVLWFLRSKCVGNSFRCFKMVIVCCKVFKGLQSITWVILIYLYINFHAKCRTKFLKIFEGKIIIDLDSYWLEQK